MTPEGKEALRAVRAKVAEMISRQDYEVKPERLYMWTPIGGVCAAKGTLHFFDNTGNFIRELTEDERQKVEDYLYKSSEALKEKK